MDDPIQLCLLCEELGFIGGRWLMDVVMNIAVTDMAERVWPNTRHPSFDRGVCAGDESRDFAHRYGDIVLNAGAFEFLRLDQAFANAPEIARLRAAFGDNAVLDEPGFHTVRKETLQRLEQPALRLAR